jgi:lipopolysaccharide export system protein LptA
MQKLLKFIQFFNVLIAVFFIVSFAGFAEAKVASNPKPSKIHITSNSLVVNNKTKAALFSGKVVVIKGSLKILSDKLNVLYTKKNKIKKLIATGNVHIIKGKDNITGKMAVFYNLTRIAIITGNPVAWEGKNRISGEKIEMNLKTGISTILSGKKKRVTAIVYSSKSLAVVKSSKSAKKK